MLIFSVSRNFMNPLILQNQISDLFRQQLQFPYFFFSRDFHNRINKYETGVIIFSKYPIVDSSQAYFRSDIIQKTESLIAADININGKIIRVYTTHLQSVLFKQKDFRNVEIVRNAEDSMLEASRSLAKKLKERTGTSWLPG